MSAAFDITAQPLSVFHSNDGSTTRQIGSLYAAAFDAALQQLVDTQFADAGRALGVTTC